MSDAALGASAGMPPAVSVGVPYAVRLVAVTGPDGALHVLALHVEGARAAAHVSLGAPQLADAFAATRCESDDELADLVAHALPLDPAAETRRIEIVHLSAPRLRPTTLAGPFGERYEFAHSDAPAMLVGRAWLLASAHVAAGPWAVALGAPVDGGAGHDESPSHLEQARAAAGEAAPFAPFRLVLGDVADGLFDVVDARTWCREFLDVREVAS